MLGEFVEKGKPKVFPYFEGLLNNNQEKKDLLVINYMVKPICENILTCITSRKPLL